MCEAIQEMYDDGVRDGMEAGMKAGMEKKLIEQVSKKLKKGFSTKEIVDILEENITTIQKISDIIQTFNGAYTIDDVYERLHK